MRRWTTQLRRWWLSLPLSLIGGAPLAAQEPPTPVVRVSGEVRDSVTGQPLAGAVVQLVSQGAAARIRSATTDARGTFVLPEVPAGVYLAGFLHPLQEQLGIEGTLLRVEITNTEPVTLALGTPSARTLLAMRCGPSVPGRPNGALFGVVRRTRGRTLTTPARIRVQYTQFIVGERGMDRRTISPLGESGLDGSFVVCGLPPGSRLTARAFAEADSSGFVELDMPSTGILVRSFAIGAATRVSGDVSTGRGVRGSARLRGQITSVAGTPIRGAVVSVLGSVSSNTSNANGQYTLTELPEGSYLVEARALGFQPVRTIVELDADREVTADLVARALPAALDTMRVRADRMTVPLADFDRRRRLGFGHFLTEAQITARAPSTVADVFRSTPGVVTMPGQFGRDRVLLRSTGMTGDCAPAVFLNGLNVPNDDGDLDALINARDIRAVEIYARTASMPIEFQTRTGCGSIVIWTGARTGTGGR
ncbi:MAG: carboxypeptidase regulatory-like domain-containing protein [Gemmatimonadaceae bacterium]